MDSASRHTSGRRTRGTGDGGGREREREVDGGSTAARIWSAPKSPRMRAAALCHLDGGAWPSRAAPGRRTPCLSGGREGGRGAVKRVQCMARLSPSQKTPFFSSCHVNALLCGSTRQGGTQRRREARARSEPTPNASIHEKHARPQQRTATAAQPSAIPPSLRIPAATVTQHPSTRKQRGPGRSITGGRQASCTDCIEQREDHPYRTGAQRQWS